MARQKEKMKALKKVEKTHQVSRKRSPALAPHRRNGGMKVKTIHQTIRFKAAPREIYSILMSSSKHGALTGGKASIPTHTGGMYAIMDGWVHGVNVRLKKNKDIVQTWVCADWPNHHASVVHFHFFPMKDGKETKLEFVHQNVPTFAAKEIARGWKQYYWNPLKAMLEK